MGADGYFDDLHKHLLSFLCPFDGAITFSPGIPFVHYEMYKMLKCQDTSNAKGKKC